MDLRPHQRKNRRKLLNDVATAQGFESTDPQLSRTVSRIRGSFASRSGALIVFDELSSVAPGPDHLRVIAALLLVQATEDRRMSREWIDAVRKGNTEEAKELSDALQEHRRSGRALSGISAQVAKLAKVQSDIDVGSQPAEIQFRGAESIAAGYAALPEAVVIDPPDEDDPA
jgi:cytochrome P450